MTNVGNHVLRAIGMAILLATPLFAEDKIVSRLTDAVQLAYRPDVQKELEMVDDQVAGMRQGNKEIREALEALQLELAVASPEEILSVREKVLTLTRKLLDQKEKARQDLLLPNQRARLEQLIWQYRSLDDPIEAFSDSVSLTEQQRDKMEAKIVSLRQDLLDEMWTFHNRSQQQMLEVLTPAQRLEWKTKAGKAFKFESTSRGLQALRRLK